MLKAQEHLIFKRKWAGSGYSAGVV